MELANNDDNTMFCVVFHEGYSFRHLIEFFKNMGCTQIDLFVSEQGIYIAESNEAKTLFIVVEIFRDQLVEFKYSSNMPFTIISLGMKELYEEVKSVPKKKALKIYKAANDALHIRIQKLDSYRLNDMGGTIIPLITKTKAKNMFTEPTYNIQRPVCIVPVSDFMEKCKEFSTYEHIILRSSQKGIGIVGKSSDSMPKYEHFGDFDMHEDYRDYTTEQKSNGSETNNIGSNSSTTVGYQSGTIINYQQPVVNNGIRLRPELIKSLTKLNNITPGGIIQFFVEKERENGCINYKPLYISSLIGSYGRLKIFIR